MLRLRMIALATTMALAACSQQPESAANPPAATASAAASTAATAATDMTSNPFFSASTLPFQAPPFDRIKDADYQPAFDEGMRQHWPRSRRSPTTRRRRRSRTPSWRWKRAGGCSARVSMALQRADRRPTPTTTLQKVQEDVAPKLAAHADAIYLNPKLFQRVEAIYDQRDTLKLDPESKRLVEWYYRDFVHAGAHLSDADKAS